VIAIERAGQAMLSGGALTPDSITAKGEPTAMVSGIAGIERFAEELPGWAKRPDVLELAGFNASCIEKFGNGGGNFRRLYAGFLDWVLETEPDLIPAEAPALARKAADGWTGASTCLYEAAKQGPLPALFDQAAGLMHEVASTERRLFEGLAAG